MSYTAPTITGSGATFAQLQTHGVSGHVELLIGANSFTAGQKSLLREITGGLAHIAMNRYFAAVRSYNQGDPVAQSASLQIILDFNTVFATLSAQAAEAGVLVAANAGTLTTKLNAAGMPQPYRHFP